jgi:hypothetical protein
MICCYCHWKMLTERLLPLLLLLLLLLQALTLRWLPGPAGRASRDV